MADGQFAALGLSLLSCLANINQGLDYPKTVPSEDIHPSSSGDPPNSTSEDLGEALDRDSLYLSREPNIA